MFLPRQGKATAKKAVKSPRKTTAKPKAAGKAAAKGGKASKKAAGKGGKGGKKKRKSRGESQSSGSESNDDGGPPSSCFEDIGKGWRYTEVTLQQLIDEDYTESGLFFHDEENNKLIPCVLDGTLNKDYESSDVDIKLNPLVAENNTTATQRRKKRARVDTSDWETKTTALSNLRQIVASHTVTEDDMEPDE